MRLLRLWKKRKMVRNNSSPTLKKFLKKIKKTLDKRVKLWYNNYRERKKEVHKKCSNGLKKKQRKLLNT
jgi:hypothetical protein